MPFADLRSVRIHYSLTGPDSGPVLVMSSSLGANLSMWDTQVAALSSRYRLLRYSTRGHGQSSAPPGPYSIATLANDVLNLLDALRFDRVHFCGLSMGGQTGMWLGQHAPSRLNKLVLCNTGATIGTHEAWNARIDTVLSKGLTDVSSAVVSRWFTPDFALLHPDAVASAKSMIESANPGGYASCCAAVRDFDVRDNLSSISVPTLVIAGAHDFATPAADGRFLAENIPGAQYVELRAAHLSNIEAAAQFISVVETFLSA